MFEREKTKLDETITEEFLKDYTFSGCVPAHEIAVVKAPGTALTQSIFTTDGRTDGEKLRKLWTNGFTIRLGNIQRVMPFMARTSRIIQSETGYSNYVHAFLTPARQQGLQHHWDQQMAIVTQIAGTKRWSLWRSPVESPMRDYNESWRVWREDFVDEWESSGPDMEFDLQAGQTLLLPRGWVHNPRVVDEYEPSFHLTFAIRERTPLWLSEKLVGEAIKDPAFRRIITPSEIGGPQLAARLYEVREALRDHLDGLDLDDLAGLIRRAATAELEYRT
ncbi:JmjC domain-containing protein [Streptomyces sp. NPDC001009]